MTVALAGRAPATFEIKSANLPLVSLLLKSPDLDALAAELNARFGESPDFFDNDPMVVDLSPLQAQPEAQIDIAALIALLRRYRVLPVAARGGHPLQMQAALAAGLAAAPEAVAAPLALVRKEPAVPAPAPSALTEPALTSALIIDRPLRSCQQIEIVGLQQQSHQRQVGALDLECGRGASCECNGHQYGVGSARSLAVAT